MYICKTALLKLKFATLNSHPLHRLAIKEIQGYKVISSSTRVKYFQLEAVCRYEASYSLNQYHLSFLQMYPLL